MPRSNPKPDAPALPAEGGAVRRRGPRPKLLAYTNRDIAALAGVSVVTVSRYFNTPEQVSEALRERLRAAVEATGYVPSQVAKRLASSRGGVVGAIMQAVGSPTFASVVQGMGHVLEQASLQLLLASSDYRQEAEERAVQAFLGWHPSALILTRGDHTPQLEAQLRAARIPIVEAWDMVEGRPFHQVGFRHQDVGRMQARHFIGQGARRIWFALSGATGDVRARRRAEGYRAAMRGARLKAEVVTAAAADDLAAGEEILARYAALAATERPDAIAFASDNMAIAAILRAPAYRVAIPRDCAVAGFGDAPLAAIVSPALTSVRPQPYEIGRAAAEAVLRLLRGDDAADYLHCEEVPCTLVVRDSSVLAPRP
ncbi:LacI family DNA-binding transcriptional regulator [Bordetella sp. 2513F-2]